MKTSRSLAKLLHSLTWPHVEGRGYQEDAELHPTIPPCSDTGKTPKSKLKEQGALHELFEVFFDVKNWRPLKPESMRICLHLA